MNKFPEISDKNHKITAPIYGPEKCICVGLNYSDHCSEQNLPEPKQSLKKKLEVFKNILEVFQNILEHFLGYQ